jgi:DNA polymerase V
MLKQVFALVDCNNFFVSCERAFQPSLEHKPVMVLSSNDGCVISRSKEVKQLGIPMGMPFFKCKDIVKEHGIVVFSSNFSLYGDLSHRVMGALNQFTDKIEIYSIDEAFLQLDYSPDNEEFCRTIKKIVRQWTRIPVSIGIAPTKVLAKVANHLAKKNDQYGGVVDITDKNIDDILYTVPINDIWGVGRQTTRFLTKNNISTALDLKNAPDTWIKEHLKIIA